MPDDAAINDQTPPMQPAAPAPQPAPAFTQADLDRAATAAAQKAHDAAWAESRRLRDAAGKSPTPRTETPPAPQTPAAADPLAILKLRDDFDDATADLQLPAAQKKFLREQVMSQRPADVDAFVQSFVSVWGKPTTATTTVTTPAPAPANPNAPPVVNRPAAPAPPAVTDDAPIASMSEVQRAEYLKRIGNDAFVAKWTKELQHLRVIV